MRRRELLDFDWRFKLTDAAEIALARSAAVADWMWRPGTAAEEAAVIKAEVDTSAGGWRATKAGDNTMAENSWAWFRTTLPALAGSGGCCGLSAWTTTG